MGAPSDQPGRGRKSSTGHDPAGQDASGRGSAPSGGAPPGPTRPVRHSEAFVTGGGYGMVLLLGAVEGLLGSFQYSRTAGPVPVAALVCCVALLVTCLLAGWGLRSFGGALLPAVGWVIVSFVIAMPNAEGSVVITDTAAGRWYLYGGLVSAALGVVVAFVLWVRVQPPR